MSLEKIKEIFSRRITFMLVPHGASRPRQINIPISLIIFFVLSWTGVTFWGSYLSAQHVDYWRTKLSNEVLALKVNYLSNELDRATGFLDQVKQLEAHLQDLLKYQDEASLIKGTLREKSSGTGGPTFVDQNDVTQILKLGKRDISWERLVAKVDFFKGEAQSRISTYDAITKFIDRKKRLYLSTPLGWPCPGHLTSHFGTRLDPFSGEEEFHFGVDIANSQGTPVKSTADGVVQIASWHTGYGNLVVVNHDFGFSTRYAHNSSFVVKPGDKIKRGQVVALMGATGKASGSHSHYEVWQNNRRQNPFKFLSETVFKAQNTTPPTKQIPPTPQS